MPVLRIIVIVAAAAFAGCITICGAAWKTRDAATRLLETVRRIAGSSNPKAEFEIVRHHYDGQLTEGENCTPLDCQYELTINNPSVSGTHLVPYTELKAYFTICQGNLNSFFITFQQLRRSGNSPVVHVQGDFSNEAWAPFHLNPHGRSDELWNGMTDFNFAVTHPGPTRCGCGSQPGLFLETWRVPRYRPDGIENMEGDRAECYL